MSRENVELVRRVYRRWSRGDFSGGEVFDRAVEFEMVDWPHPGRARGLEGMRRMWQATLSAWDDFRAEPSTFIENGQYVVVVNQIRARGKESGAEVGADTATLWKIEAGKVVRLALYWDIAAAFEEAGLPG